MSAEIKTILVTGGAGYIGSHFINKLLKETDFRVVVVDNFSQGRENIIRNERVLYHEADLRDRQALLDIFSKSGIDVVAHFAGLIVVPDSVTEPREYYDHNLIGGLNLLDCMIENNVKKIIFSSSVAVFGELMAESISENHPKNPVNPYGHTKHIFENILVNYHKAYGLDSIFFRYLNAAGCDESCAIGEYHKKETHVIPAIIETLQGKREEFYVYGTDYPTKDGSAIRDYVHVNDLADAHLIAIDKLFASDKLCENYNLGTDQGYSVLDLIKTAEKISGKKLNYKIKERRAGDPSRLVADSTKARRELGWKPKYESIDDIFQTAYDFFVVKGNNEAKIQ